MKTGDGLDLDRIVFIGRTYFEYLRMFGLEETDLRRGPVLDCAAGPSSFTAEAAAKGFDVVACDTLYDVSPGDLLFKGRRDIEHTFAKVDEVPHLYVWKYYRDRDEIISLRRKALERFAADYGDRAAEDRYVHAELPQLPFPDKSFSLVLASHFLFLYGDRLDFTFHVASLREMMRVASREVRVFPLQGLDAKPYPQMDALLAALQAERIEAAIDEVPFEFQKGSNKMLRLRHRL